MGFIGRLFGKKERDTSNAPLRFWFSNYQGLHFWIESRLGPLTKAEDPEKLHNRLLKLLDEEEGEQGTGNVAVGLEVYIETYKYRKMLRRGR
jgi:hypothetical protein